jgi:hypothetical protein
MTMKPPSNPIPNLPNSLNGEAKIQDIKKEEGGGKNEVRITKVVANLPHQGRDSKRPHAREIKIEISVDGGSTTDRT